jgi:uncharacterized membrane protein
VSKAPDPTVPEPSLWPLVLLGVIVAVTVLTIVHAARHRRWGWIAGLVLGLPLVLPLYWVVELVRGRRRSVALSAHLV